MSHTLRDSAVFIVVCCITLGLGAASVARAESAPYRDTGFSCAASVSPASGAIRADLGMIRLAGSEVVIDPANAFVRVLEGGATVAIEIRVEASGLDTIVNLPVPLEEGRYRFEFEYRGCPGTSRQRREYEAFSAPRVESLGTLSATALLATNVRRGSPELVYFVEVELRTHLDLAPWLGLWEVGLTVDGTPFSDRTPLHDPVSWRLPVTCPPRETPTEPQVLALVAGAGAPGVEPSLFAETTAHVDCDSAVRVDPRTLIPLTEDEAASWDTEASPPPPSGALDAGPGSDAAPTFHDAAGRDPDSRRREEHESCSASPGTRGSSSGALAPWLLALAAIVLRRARPSR